MPVVARVLVPLPLAEPFDYLVPETLKISVGHIVCVPFGKQEKKGIVWEMLGNAAQLPPRKFKLKEIVRKYDTPPFPEATLKFIDWVAQYSMSPRGAVFAMCASVEDALDAPPPAQGLIAGNAPLGKLTAARQRVMASVDAAAVPPGIAALAKAAGVSEAVVRTLLKQGALQWVALAQLQEAVYDADAAVRPKLSTAQAQAAASLVESVKEGKFSATLLEGVTGSGKTEVYCEAVAAALAKGKQALVLLPEIALTSQLAKRFKTRFGMAPCEWHSHLTPATRRKHWRQIASGEARVILGARSALFLPYPSLGLIVVDEEHEHAYKQEEGVPYHGRDMAVVRTNLEAIPVVLASATPSLETLVNVKLGKYARVHLPERHGSARMPEVTLIDMRQEKLDAQHWLSAELKEAMARTLESGEQVLLFLNRRGYAPLTLCRNCGFRFCSPDSTAWMVLHQPKHRPAYLQCHHSGFTMPLPEKCPECSASAKESFAACGPGIERLAEEVAEAFPSARLVQMTSDTMSKSGQARQVIDRILAREVDIILGTQLAAKGYHFPHLTLVGVVDGDLGLDGGDLRAAENSFQLLAQVSGRAGREERPGRAMVQTYMPEHPVMHFLAAHDREGFITYEMDSRFSALMPPFGRLAAIILSGKDQGAVQQAVRELSKHIPQGKDVQVLGPAPAPISQLRGRFRYRFLVHAPKAYKIQPFIARWLGEVKLPSAIRCKVDIDPYNFL